MIYEASDVLYHLLVLLAHHEIKLDEVETEISRRFGQSGLEEKAARTVGRWAGLAKTECGLHT